MKGFEDMEANNGRERSRGGEVNYLHRELH